MSRSGERSTTGRRFTCLFSFAAAFKINVFAGDSRRRHAKTETIQQASRRVCCYCDYSTNDGAAFRRHVRAHTMTMTVSGVGTGQPTAVTTTPQPNSAEHAASTPRPLDNEAAKGAVTANVGVPMAERTRSTDCGSDDTPIGAGNGAGDCVAAGVRHDATEHCHPSAVRLSSAPLASDHGAPAGEDVVTRVHTVASDPGRLEEPAAKSVERFNSGSCYGGGGDRRDGDPVPVLAPAVKRTLDGHGDSSESAQESALGTTASQVLGEIPTVPNRNGGEQAAPQPAKRLRSL